MNFDGAEVTHLSPCRRACISVFFLHDFRPPVALWPPRPGVAIFPQNCGKIFLVHSLFHNKSIFFFLPFAKTERFGYLFLLEGDINQRTLKYRKNRFSTPLPYTHTRARAPSIPFPHLKGRDKAARCASMLVLLAFLALVWLGLGWGPPGGLAESPKQGTGGGGATKQFFVSILEMVDRC